MQGNMLNIAPKCRALLPTNNTECRAIPIPTFARNATQHANYLPHKIHSNSPNPLGLCLFLNEQIQKHTVHFQNYLKAFYRYLSKQPRFSIFLKIYCKMTCLAQNPIGQAIIILAMKSSPSPPRLPHSY
jgi:hypothetical protein